MNRWILHMLEYIILKFLLLLIFVTLYVGVATGGHRLRKQSTFTLPTVTTGPL